MVNKHFINPVDIPEIILDLSNFSTAQLIPTRTAVYLSVCILKSKHMHDLLKALVLHFTFLARERVSQSSIVASIHNRFTGQPKFTFSWHYKQWGVK